MLRIDARRPAIALPRRAAVAALLAAALGLVACSPVSGPQASGPPSAGPPGPPSAGPPGPPSAGPPGSSPPGPSSPAPSTGSSAPAPALAVEVVATGLTAPWSVTFEGDTPLVSLRDAGTIVELLADGSHREVGTVPGVKHGGEGGLLGILADGRRHLYVYSTGEEGNRLQRLDLEGEPGALRLGASRDLLTGIPAAGTHNGGRLAWGPDGMLYATTGDAGQPERAQDRDSLAGKILRLRPDGSIPPDNPWPDSLVYSLGHRNPQGVAWDAEGRMYAAEFGQNTWDELNLIRPGGNYGWPLVEGRASREGFTDPLWQASPSQASPSGMALRDGRVLLAALRGRALLSVPVRDGSAAPPQDAVDALLDGHGRLRDVVNAPDGRLWILTNNTDGRGEPTQGDDQVLAVDPGGE